MGKVLLILLKDEEGRVLKPSRIRDQTGRCFRVSYKPEFGNFVCPVAEDGSSILPVKDKVEILRER